MALRLRVFPLPTRALRAAAFAAVFACTLPLPAAVAADKAPADKTAADKAPAGPTVRPEMAKILNGTQELLKKNQFKEAFEATKAADSVPAPPLTPFETFTLTRLRAVSLVGMGDMAAADPLQEQVVASTGQDVTLSKEDRLAVDRLMAERWYNKKPETMAVKWARRYFADGGTDDKFHTIIVQSLYASGDCAATIEAAKTAIASNDAAGVTPTESRLQMLSVCQQKTKDDAGRLVTLERLTSLYPKPVYWNNLLAAVERQPGFEDYMLLDTFRLRFATGSMTEGEDYVDMAHLATQAGYPAEAKRVLDAGVAAGMLGEGKGGADYLKERTKADNGAAEDLRQLGQADARAAAGKDGIALFTTGLDYVSHLKYDQGLPMMASGLARGGLKRPEQSRLQLGEAYAMAGHKDEALKLLAEVKGEDGSAAIAHLWTLYIKGQK